MVLDVFDRRHQGGANRSNRSSWAALGREQRPKRKRKRRRRKRARRRRKGGGAQLRE